MKKRGFLWLIIFFGLILLSIQAQQANARITEQILEDKLPVNNQQAAQTLIPTVTPSTIGIQVGEPRTLPAVGGNAGLVIAASVLVLIIIGGVMLSSRRKSEY